MGLAANLASARVSLGRIFEVLDTAPEIMERPDAVTLDVVRGDITFDNVTLRHDRADVLSGVSFTIPAGTFCAILGPSGVGKSTVATFLSAFSIPTAAAFRSMGMTCATSASRISAITSAWSIRRPICSTRTSPKTFPTLIPSQPAPKLKPPEPLRASMN